MSGTRPTRQWVRRDAGGVVRAMAGSPDRPPGEGWTEAVGGEVVVPLSEDDDTTMPILPFYPNDAAAVAAGLTAGALYRNSMGVQQVQPPAGG